MKIPDATMTIEFASDPNKVAEVIVEYLRERSNLTPEERTILLTYIKLVSTMILYVPKETRGSA